MPRALTSAGISIVEGASISTWFGIGGCADRLARPIDVEQVRACIELDPELCVLGDGANLLVDDAGISRLVLDTGGLDRVDWDSGSGLVRAEAGANLPKLVIEAVRRGLGGLEGLGGIPASIGGAAIMNAGGAFGEFADVVARVHAISRDGREVVLEREEIDYGYRRSGLNGVVVTAVELRLGMDDPGALRSRLVETMAYKKRTQPMADDSAGCVFKNPVLSEAIDGIGDVGARVSAGMLIDRAGCRGLRVGGAEVSDRHANFIVTESGARARDVIDLMDAVAERVGETYGVRLDPEVVIWRNDQ